jgi:DNA-binding NarL/FixJ family response regulator
MTRDTPLGIVLAEGPHVVRIGLATLLSMQSDMEILVESGDAVRCLEAMRRLPRQTGVVALIGLSLQYPNDAYWLIRSIRDIFPTMPVLASAANPDDLAISSALFQGADGFVDQSVEPGEFLDAVRSTARGETVLAGVPETWLGRIADDLELQSTPERVLSDRETQVLRAASKGLTAREIGRRLGMRERTVTTHLTHIYKKLGASNRVGAVTAAAQSGLVALARQV